MAVALGWWQLPGPSRFVDRIVDDLRDGRHVVVELPEHAPPGLDAAIRARVGQEIWAWTRFRIPDRSRQGPAPAEHLFARFVPHSGPRTLRDAAALAREECFHGHLIWLEATEADNWVAWRDFLVDYGQACRSRAFLERSLFVVPLVGAIAAEAPVEDVCIARHRWDAAVDSLDTLLYTADLLRDQPLPGLQKRLVGAVTAGLALWDPAVSESFAREPLAAITDPLPTLRAIAEERGWAQTRLQPDGRSWQLGLTHQFDGAERVHSALLAINGSSNTELTRRIWSAQVGVLFPFIEERRHELLDRLNGVLTVPFTTSFGTVIADARDLEFGHIDSQIGRLDLPVDAATRRLIAQLHDIRNQLAHLRPINLTCLDLDVY